MNNDTRQIHVDETREMWDVMKDDRYALSRRGQSPTSAGNMAGRIRPTVVEGADPDEVPKPATGTIREKNLIRNKACFEPTRESAPQARAKRVAHRWHATVAQRCRATYVDNGILVFV